MKTKYKKFFIVSDNEICVTSIGYFDSILSWSDAYSLGLNCFLGIQKTLKQDAVDGYDSFLGTIRVTKGLDRTLEELNKRFPSLLNQIQNTDLKFDGNKIFRC